MPWKETDAMSEKERFVILSKNGRFTISELCKDFGISRDFEHALKVLTEYELEWDSIASSVLKNNEPVSPIIKGLTL